jgi:hypothetical protein
VADRVRAVVTRQKHGPRQHEGEYNADSDDRCFLPPRQKDPLPQQTCLGRHSRGHDGQEANVCFSYYHASGNRNETAMDDLLPALERSQREQDAWLARFVPPKPREVVFSTDDGEKEGGTVEQALRAATPPTTPSKPLSRTPSRVAHCNGGGELQEAVLHAWVMKYQWASVSSAAAKSRPTSARPHSPTRAVTADTAAVAAAVGGGRGSSSSGGEVATQHGDMDDNPVPWQSRWFVRVLHTTMGGTSERPTDTLFRPRREIHRTADTSCTLGTARWDEPPMAIRVPPPQLTQEPRSQQQRWQCLEGELAFQVPFDVPFVTVAHVPPV